MGGSVNGSRSSKNDAEEIERREANSTVRLVGEIATNGHPKDLTPRYFLRCLLFLRPHLTHSLGGGFPLCRREIPFLPGWCSDRCGGSIAGNP
jgi:hypothetical protein